MLSKTAAYIAMKKSDQGDFTKIIEIKKKKK